MKKGFTLVELLAVIVILSILLLIAIPIIEDSIASSQASADISSIKIYGRAVDQAIELYQLTEKKNPQTFTDIEPYIHYSGNTVTCNTKVLNDDLTVYLSNCYIDGVLIEDGSYGREPEMD